MSAVQRWMVEGPAAEALARAQGSTPSALTVAMLM
jgi:hypothetical protein